FYKEHFNKRLQEETGKIEFKLTYNYSEKQFFGEEAFREEANLSERKEAPVKYTRIDLTQEEMDAETATLEKVPHFLMKLLDPQKSLATI
ncbi:hypothetical protein DAPPUDRAFT_273915, partial [Daphnia pulex]